MSGIPTWHQRAMAHPDHQSGMISERMIRARMCEEIEDLRAEIERLHNDAMRYRWLRKQKALHLVSDGAFWIRENGKNFRASHALSANNTRYGACETLDETIDEAMRGEIASKDADIERLRKALEAKP